MAQDTMSVESDAAAGERVRTTGESAKGEFRCVECGYGVAIYRELPLCPMCGSSTWEQSGWSPFTRGTASAA